MRRWDYSVTEISVTGREIFHMTMPTELQSTSSSRKKMQAEDCYCLFFGLALKKCFFSDIQRREGGGRGITNAHSGSCAPSVKMGAHT